MAKRTRQPVRRKKTVKGRGLIGKLGQLAGTVINKGIDLLPVELHLPGGYRYCGPGTKLKERLARGDPGINGLDEACKAHDIAYSKYKDNENRRKADKELANRAWARVKASNSSLGERAAAWAVTTAMNAKAKLGGGRRKKRRPLQRKKVRGKGLYLRPYKGSGGGTKKKKKQGCLCRKKKKASR